MDELWMPIAGYEGRYEVSNFGRVRSAITGIILKPAKHYKGHEFLFLYNGGRKKYFVHRLVAIVFIPNPECLPVVNHLDGCKTNNVPSNLEWTTVRGNTIHYHQMRKERMSQSV